MKEEIKTFSENEEEKKLICKFVVLLLLKGFVQKQKKSNYYSIKYPIKNS